MKEAPESVSLHALFELDEDPAATGSPTTHEQGAASPETQHALAVLLPELTGYFMRRLAHLDDASDAAADTLYILLSKGDAVPESHDRLRQYAYGIARKVLLQARRGRIRRTALAEQLRRELPQPSQTIHVAAQHPDLRAALAKLPDKDRELLLLVAWEGFGIAEAGTVLGLRPAAARKRYSRLREKLRAELG